ncbi:MAG: M28 family metallopeptidase [Amphiplicatus sp.]
MRLSLVAISACSLLAACAAETGPKTAPAPSPGAGGQDAAVDRLEADVRFLADDLLEGREAGTRGYELAALYVAERYRALGLEPAGDDGTYFQTVPMRSFASAMENGGTLTLTGSGAPDSLEAGDDYLAGRGAGAAKGSVEAPVVFVGYGFVSEKHNRDDYAGLDVEGKIVAYYFGAPKFLNTEERAHFNTVRGQTASQHGAIGVITLMTPSLAKVISYDQIREITAHQTYMNWLEPSGDPFTLAPNLEGNAFLSPSGAEKLFAKARVKWAELEAAAEEEQGDVKGFPLDVTARIAYDYKTEDTKSPNVIGVLPGTDPALKDEYIVLTGHLDHEGIKTTPEEGDDEIYNGAMDNATGIASMLEVARLLKADPPKRPVMFVALTAEEKGLVGSDYLARNAVVGKDMIAANVNLDMPIMTYNFTDIVAFGAERSTLGPVVEAAVERAGLELTPDAQPDEGFFTRSDQYSFVKQGVPAIYLRPNFGGDGERAQTEFREKHYHQPSDEAGLIDYAALARFSQVNYEIARGVANMDKRPRWNKGDFFGETFKGPMAE